MTQPNDLEKLQSEMSAAVKAHWKAFLFEGILLVILGLAAMIVPPIASLAVTIFLGWMFLISGIGGLIVTYWARNMPGFWWSLISAALAVLAGGILLARPMQAVLTLTIVVGAYFLAEGVTTIMYALEHRRELTGRWSWMLVAGLMDIVIAFIVIAGLPGSAEWVLGLLVGVNLLFGGATLIGMALAVLAGGILLARPVQGVLTLTIVVGAYFLAEGVTTIMYALEHRRELTGRWSWMLVAGLMDIVIAFIVIAGLPGSAEWVLGLLVGINLLFGGATLIGMALAARKAAL